MRYFSLITKKAGVDLGADPLGETIHLLGPTLIRVSNYRHPVILARFQSLRWIRLGRYLLRVGLHTLVSLNVPSPRQPSHP